MALSIGVDVGGTKIAAGVVDEEGAVLERIQRASPANDRASILDTIVDCALELKESHPEAVAVGIGAAGFVSSDRNTMASGTNLDWTGVRIGDVVAERVGLPVVVENDANAAGWAEARFGAGAGKRNVLVVTLGTGVGGAIVIDGRLVRGAAGFGVYPRERRDRGSRPLHRDLVQCVLGVRDLGGDPDVERRGRRGAHRFRLYSLLSYRSKKSSELRNHG